MTKEITLQGQWHRCAKNIFKKGLCHVEKENINTLKPLKGIRLNWTARLRSEMRNIALTYLNTINSRTKNVELFNHIFKTKLRIIYPFSCSLSSPSTACKYSLKQTKPF